MNTQTLEDRMMLMKPHELQQFASMHKNDPYVLPLAMKISDMRNKLKVAEGMQYAGQKQPTVADQAIASINPQQAPQQAAPQQALPENQGIGPLAAPNIQGMADGGIAGYAGGTPKGTFDPDVYLANPNVQKYLAYINAYEGKPKENHLVGYKSFDDLSDHPNQRVRFGKSKNQVSTAAGSYQILKRSWDDQKKKLGLTDFSLENQQRAAIGLLKEHGALQDVAKGNFQKANEKAKNIWASLPGSTIGESTGQRARVKPELEAALKKKDGIERLATAPAEKQAAPVQPRRVAQREEKFGLNPDLAQFFNKFMPGSEAQAGELPPTSVSKLPANVNQPAAPAPAKAPEKGMWDALKDRVENASKSGILALPSMINPNIGKYLHNKEYTVPAESPSMAEIRSIEQGKKVEPRPAQKVTVPSAAEKLVAAPVAATALATEMASPFTGAANLGLSRLLGNKDKTYEEAAREMSYAPRSDAAQDALYDMHKALDKSKLPPYFDVPGALPMRGEKPLMSQAEQAGRVNRATDAATALNRQMEARARAAEGPKQGELDLGPGGSEAGLSADAALRAQQKMYQDAVAAAEAKRAQTDAARAKGAQGELFETGTNTPPVEMVNPAYERARIANDIRNEQKAQVADTAKAGEAARVKQAATEKLKADESVKAGERQLDKQSESRRALEEVLAGNASNRKLGQGFGLGTVGLKGELPPTNTKGYDDSYMTGGDPNYKFDSKPEDFIPKPVKKEVIAETKASPEGKEVKKAGMDFSDKDWLNLGLNLLSAKSEGQRGIQGFLSNLGTAGKETLVQKQEREKTEAAKAFQDIQGKYYTGITENLGKPQGEERLIARMAEEQQIPFSDAAEQYYGMRQTDRTNVAGLVTAYNQAKLLDPSAAGMSFQQWAKANGIPLSQTQQTAIDPAAMEIYNRVMKKGG